jgi:hypothetical protein
VVIPNLDEKHFWPSDALPNMALDQVYAWGRPGAMLGAVGHLRNIYRVSDEVHEQERRRARIALKAAFQRTQSQLSDNPTLQALFDPLFVKHLLDWNRVVKGYLRQKPNTAACSRWKEKRRELLAKREYEEHEIDEYLNALEPNRRFLESLSFLFLV